MNIEQYFHDLAAELKSVQNRIRSFIGDAHWPSDGAWKESVIRTVLRGHLPKSLNVGSGFILTADGPSTQIDILIYDDTAPLFFKDGDFVVVPPHSVKAVIEVKTSISSTNFAKAAGKLDALSRILKNYSYEPKPFIGLFAFDGMNVKPDAILKILNAKNSSSDGYAISAVCLGDSDFFRFWTKNPQFNQDYGYDHWHAYRVPGMSPGYFIHNIIDHLYPTAFRNAEDLWYPAEGKESKLAGSINRNPEK